MSSTNIIELTPGELQIVTGGLNEETKVNLVLIVFVSAAFYESGLPLFASAVFGLMSEGILSSLQRIAERIGLDHDIAEKLKKALNN